MRLSTHLASVMAGLSVVSTGLLIPLVSSGPYSVGLNIKTLVDESRWDPYAPIDIPQKRRILISTFAPVNTQENSCPHGEVNFPYMPPKTRDVFGRQAEAMGLPSGVFEDLQLKFCRLPDINRLQKHALKNGTKLSVVIFSPGRGVSRLMYSAMARSVASHGYIVITVDHAYDASIIEYPDGTDTTGVVGEANKTVLEISAKVRSQDIMFVIDQIQDNVTTSELFGLSQTGSVFVFGHSIGGATVVSTLFSDLRIQGVINLDGDMLGPVVKAGLDKPLFLIGRPHSRDQGPSWNETWNSQRGPGMMLQIDGITHQSFLDAPLLVSLRDVPEGSRDKVQAALGTINGRRMASLVIQLTVGILDTGKTPPERPTMDDDIAKIVKDLTPVVEEAGEEGVVAVMHSAGGFIGSGALKGLTCKARQDVGRTGGVKKIVFIAAGVAPEGFEQGPMDFFDYHESNGTQSCKDPRNLLYSDFSDEEVNKWLPGLQHQADRGWATKLQYCGWREVPSVYIICDGDKILPAELQERFARLAGSEIVRIGAGHMVQLSQTEKVADIVASHAD
ncbi:hypothetical protein FPRO05_12408 [Fusarium proliferatum]|uniref:AB hydrolase-1 domain-containing protein n=1 Tax=Gibberella intermedia TaxID=948311 RepID=A0A365N4Q8_GIBIN|nr:hypothetical protein FPRO05_12408 [Fusarium proliferatum]